MAPRLLGGSILKWPPFLNRTFLTKMIATIEFPVKFWVKWAKLARRSECLFKQYEYCKKYGSHTPATSWKDADNASPRPPGWVRPMWSQGVQRVEDTGLLETSQESTWSRDIWNVGIRRSCCHCYPAKGHGHLWRPCMYAPDNGDSLPVHLNTS